MIDEIKITSLSGRGSVIMKTRDYQGYWLGPVDWGQVQGSHNTYSFRSQVGADIVSTTIQPRSLSVTGWIIDDPVYSLQSRCDFLNSFISPVEDYILEYKARKIQFRPDSSVAYSPERRKNNEKVRQFLIQATCPYPLFSDLDDTEIPFSDSKKLFRFPTDFGQSKPVVFGSTSRAYGMTVSNPGGFATGLLAVIEFSDAVQNPQLRNNTTEKFIRVNRTFTRGERLEISTAPGSRRITLYTADREKQDAMKYRDYRSSLDMLLQPGKNVLAVSCEDMNQIAAMKPTIYFTPLYLEVE